MRYSNMLPFRAALVAAPLFLGFASAQASSGLTQEYCSSENTGSDYSAVYNIYQSNGACYTQCLDNYAFAVVQYQNCWCSNYIPADQQDTGSCSQKCPGYPSDLCGDKDAGLYGYIKLRNQPSGTAGAASSSSTPTSSSSEEQPSSSVPPQTSSVSLPTTTSASSSSTTESSVTPTPTTSSISTIPTPSSSTEAAVVSTSSSSATHTNTPSAVVTTRVVTQSGAVVTQTVTSTPIVIPNQAGSNEDEVMQRQGLSGGAIAGIVVAVLLALLAVAIGAFFLWRRRGQERDATALAGTKGSRGSPRRNVSVLSKAGLLRGNTDMAENTYDEPLYVNTGNNSVRHSTLFGAGGNAHEGVSPVSPLGSSHDAESGNRRYSRPLVYDQRLNPSALFANQEANGSRVSIQDNADYSRSLGRTLGVANPDPRASFESRA